MKVWGKRIKAPETAANKDLSLVLLPTVLENNNRISNLEKALDKIGQVINQYIYDNAKGVQKLAVEITDLQGKISMLTKKDEPSLENIETHEPN